MREITTHDEYLDFYSELTGYLAICYSTNPNYRQDTIDYTLESRVVGYFNNLDVYDTAGNLLAEGMLLQCDTQKWVDSKPSYDKYGYNKQVLSPSTTYHIKLFLQGATEGRISSIIIIF